MWLAPIGFPPFCTALSVGPGARGMAMGGEALLVVVADCTLSARMVMVGSFSLRPKPQRDAARLDQQRIARRAKRNGAILQPTLQRCVGIVDA